MTLDIYTHLDKSRAETSIKKLNNYYGLFGLDSQQTVSNGYPAHDAETMIIDITKTGRITNIM